MGVWHGSGGRSTEEYTRESAERRRLAQDGWPPESSTAPQRGVWAIQSNNQASQHTTGERIPMTTEIITTANNVIVVGLLDTMLVRDRNAARSEGRKMVEVTKKVGRDWGRGGRWQNLKLQVRSPYGGMFALPIEIEPDVSGAALLEAAEAETMLAIEGTLQLVQTFDGRFATDARDTRGRTDRGRPTRALQLRVRCVREPNPDERRASSAVWLEGVIAEPPQISRHPELPSMQLAGTILRVTYARPADFPGLAATITETVEVNLSIPISHQDAEQLYRQGNVVRVIGQLDCRMEVQGGLSVRAKLAEIDAEWAERKAQLSDKLVEVRKAESAYRRTRQRFETAARLFVLAGHVELLAGEPLSLEETYALRREFVRNRRQQQEARRQRTADEQAQRAARAARPSDVAEHVNDMPILGIADVGIHPEAGMTRPGRPRKRVDAAESAAVVTNGERVDEPIGEGAA
jgi:hypothetical protein